jgi:hypothetical protein
MNILGETFYNMQTHEPVTFTIPQVELVMVQPVELSVLDAYSMDVVDESVIYVVVVVLQGDSFAASKPLENKVLAHAIADKLAKACEKYQSRN